MAALLLLMLASGCKREDPRIRELTERAAQADEASQELRQAWSEQLQRLSRAGVKDLPPGFVLMHFSEAQKVALEARIREERNVSRQALLKELLEKDRELVGLGDRLALMKAELPVPDLVRSNDSHYGLAMRFLKGRGCTEAEAKAALSRVAIFEKIAPGFEVYHFYRNGTYGSWVARGSAPYSPQEFARMEGLASARDEAVGMRNRLKRELVQLESQKKSIEGEIAAIESERRDLSEGSTRLQLDNARQLAGLNSLHYLVGVRDRLRDEGVIEIPFFDKDHSGPAWQDKLFTQSLDLREHRVLLIHAKELGITQISKVVVVPGSYVRDEHYRLTLSEDRQTATVELLSVPRFKNEKVVFAVVE